MERVFPLALQGLNRERTFQGHLIGIKVRGSNHLCQKGQQMLRVFHRAAQAQDESVFLRITAQTCAASLHKVSQLNVVVSSAASAEQGCQQVMGSPSPDRVVRAAKRKQQFRGQNPRAGDRFDQ